MEAFGDLRRFFLFVVAVGLCPIAQSDPPPVDLEQGAANYERPDRLPLTLAAPSHSAPLEDVGPAEATLAQGGIVRERDVVSRFGRIAQHRPRPFEPVPPSAFDSGLDRRPPRVTPGIIPDGLGFDLGDDARPYVVKYACCTALELYAQPTFTAPVLGTMALSSEVWVFDFFGAGLPGGIASCAGVPAPCPHIWAEVFSNDLSRSGYVPLTSLFDRPMVGEVGQTTFEISFGRLNALLAGALQPLIRPAGCATQDPYISLSGWDFGNRDAFFNPTSGEGTLCQPLIDDPYEFDLMSCSGLTSDDSQFAGCIYQSEAECAATPPPDRQPSATRSLCLEKPVFGAGTCGSCRAWYDETGQTNSGALTQDEFVDECLLAIEDDDICSSTGCASDCANLMQSFKAAECANYIGPVDSKSFGNPIDYQCGEVPVGRTHPFLRYNTAVDKFTGEPDPESKLLHIFNVPNIRFPSLSGTVGRAIPVNVTIGRLDAQRAATFSIPDLTTHDTRDVNSPATLDLRQIWYRMWPDEATVKIDNATRRVRALTIRVCGFVPGNRIDLGEAVFNQNEDGLWAVVRKIDFGVVDFRRVGLCMNMRAYVDPDASDLDSEDVFVELIEVTHVDIDDVRVDGIDFEWGPAVATPFIDNFFALIAISVEHAAALFNTSDSSAEQRVIDIAKSHFADQLIDEIEPEIKDALTNALEDARADFQDSLSDVCRVISPNSPRNHPFHFFYRYMNWNCAGITSNNLIRPFLRNAASAEAGCYDLNEFITPADAGRPAWWAAYTGQEWYWPGFPDSGCRIAAEISSRPDRAIWRPLRCATMVFNTWFNRGPAPAATLAGTVAATCSQHGEDSLRDLYGNGQDLVDLYNTVHPPSGGIEGSGDLEIR